MENTIPKQLVGKMAEFTKTVGEYDIYAFAGVTGDFDPVHVDEEFCREIGLGGRIAHGLLTLGYTSTASSVIMSGTGISVVSLGYDRVRFLKPVVIGDTLTTTYTITQYESETQRLVADIEVKNQDSELVAVAKHIHKII